MPPIGKEPTVNYSPFETKRFLPQDQLDIEVFVVRERMGGLDLHYS